MADKKSKTPKPIRFLFENSIFLVAGAIAALLWANLDQASYHHFIHFNLQNVLFDPPADHAPHSDESDHGGEGSESHGEDNDHPSDGESASGEAHNADDAEGADGTEHSDSDSGEHADDAHGSASGEDHGGGSHGITIHFLINDILMALFFAIAAKEVWESILPGGALSNFRKAATPLMATAGGILGPTFVYLGGAYLSGDFSVWKDGWAIPCATDIAFSYLIARIIFGVGHPAIAFLLLLAIADDAAGLLILAVAYPSKPIVVSWLLLTVGAVALGFVFRKLRLHSHWWYLLIPGILSWYSFYMAGIHPALGLVPIIPCMPHAHTDLGYYVREELKRDDTLNAFEHWWKNPVELVLGLFGLANAGVVFSSVGTGTWLVLGGLLVGKPIGITLFTWIAEKGFKLEVPAGMGYRHVVTLGMIAGIGFTVALFVSTAAFPLTKVPEAVQDAAKMGALLSFLAAPLAIIIAKMLRVRPLKDDEAAQKAIDAA